MGRNVAFAWGGYMVNVVTGFIVPRLISDQLGQTTLGIWDFSWSIVSYFGLVQLGLGSSVSRYVAKYRSVGDHHGLNVSVSTVAVFQRCVGWLAAVLAAIAAFLILPMFADRLAGELSVARWVVFILGVEVAASISLTVYGSVIVGCHRWDIHNSISAICYALVAAGMTTALLLGGGLVSLALIHCGTMTGGELSRRYLSRRVCPELEISRRLASKPVFFEQARYSAKSLVPRISLLISNQALSLLVVAFLGPASLAIFSRPKSLIRTLQTLAAKFGFILVPTASALQARKDREGLRQAMLGSPAFIAAIALPVLVTIALFGDQVIRLWMGPQYVHPGLVPVLALGAFGTLVQEPIWSLLAGMNQHGRVALIKLGAAIASASCLGIGLAVFDWGLLGAAVCFVAPQVLVDGVIVPAYACRHLQIPVGTFIWRILALPLLCTLPFGIALHLSQRLLASSQIGLALTSAFLGTATSTLLFVRLVVPPALQSRIHALWRRLPFVRTSRHALQ